MRIIPPWILTDYPWAVTLVEWFRWFNEVWHNFQGLVVLGGFTLLWWLLRRERVRLGERIETLRQIVTAVRDQSEEALAQPSASPPNPQAASPRNGGDPPDTTALDNWEAVRSLWRETRDRIELAIDNIARTSVRGKYSKIPRYAYSDVIVQLRKDGILGPKEMIELLKMDAFFNTLKFKPKSVTPDQVSTFREAYAIGTRSLPTLPEQEAVDLPRPSPAADAPVPKQGSPQPAQGQVPAA